jgi:signal peptidase
MLISCQFRFGAVVIASPSMTGEINKGDTIIYESYEHCEGADVGDVIVFEKNPGKRVVHRIVEETVVDGELRYITKGDANEDIDAGYVTDAQIVGKVRLKLLYVGYLSLWLYEIAK